MARVSFREIYEEGNYLTGEYRRWTKEAEFEGDVSEVEHLIGSVSSYLTLPALRLRNGLLGMEKGTNQIRRLLGRRRR